MLGLASALTIRSWSTDALASPLYQRVLMKSGTVITSTARPDDAANPMAVRPIDNGGPHSHRRHQRRGISVFMFGARDRAALSASAG